MEKTECSPWGTYAPLKRSLFLRLLIAIGLGRGAVRAKILKIWIKRFGNIVDVDVRGIRYRLNLSDNVTDCKIFGSSVTYDKKELEYLQQACHMGVFVDVGANIGYYSLVLAREARCKVVAIEPNPTALERLRFNVALNSNLRDNITIVPLGVGEKGEFDLHLGNNLGGASLHNNLSEDSTKTVKITTQPLLHILTDQKIDGIDALKIDIEGMEDRALVPFFEESSSHMWPNCIVIEDDHQKMWKTDILKILRSKGYSEIFRRSGNAVLRLHN
jgi:FkbM family methyltransferase